MFARRYILMFILSLSTTQMVSAQSKNNPFQPVAQPVATNPNTATNPTPTTMLPQQQGLPTTGQPNRALGGLSNYPNIPNQGLPNLPNLGTVEPANPNKDKAKLVGKVNDSIVFKNATGDNYIFEKDEGEDKGTLLAKLTSTKKPTMADNLAPQMGNPMAPTKTTPASHPPTKTVPASPPPQSPAKAANATNTPVAKMSVSAARQH